MTKMKPKLSDDEKRLLQIRNKMNKKRPAFRRQEWFRYKRLGDSWRKPKGKHSKMGAHKGYRPPVVDSGYRNPKKVRGLHPSGFKEVLVHTLGELDSVNPEREAIRIASRVGVRKRIEIEKKAEELGIRILNPMHREGGE